MDDHALDPTCVLKVKINCCKVCPGKLKKGLLKINGVYSVSVDTEKNLVSVKGKVDPRMLIKTIAKMGKNAELESYNKEPMNDNNNGEGHFENTQTGPDKCSDKEKCAANDNDNVRHRRTDLDQGCCVHEDAFVGHKVEDYVPPPRDREFDDHICRDPYCRLHSRSHIIRDRVPPRDTAGMFWHHSHNNSHGYGGRYPQRSPCYPGWFREELHSYGHYNTRMPPPAYGYHQPRPMPGPDNFSHFFSDENTRGCTIM
ncbi:unnamed protein product [Ilex paraguariensis]|uniref:HMA domain-containing protein n=1 Tax=Ilex paraguariensis TaxID=185542 RepID=A0ABC8U267_9AQUA